MNLAGTPFSLPILESSGGHIQGGCQLRLTKSKPLPNCGQIKRRERLRLASCVCGDVSRLQELLEMLKIEGPLGIRKLLPTDHCADPKSKVWRMPGSVENQCRGFAGAERIESLLNRSLPFPVRQIKNENGGLCQLRRRVARPGLQPRVKLSKHRLPLLQPPA